MVRPLLRILITALSTAVLAGLLHLKCYAFGGYSLTNILLYIGPNLTMQTSAMLCCWSALCSS